MDTKHIVLALRKLHPDSDRIRHDINGWWVEYDDGFETENLGYDLIEDRLVHTATITVEN